jgi:hypothetical protein
MVGKILFDLFDFMSNCLKCSNSRLTLAFVVQVLWCKPIQMLKCVPAYLLTGLFVTCVF